MKSWEEGDVVTLVCPIAIGSRIGAARVTLPIGTKGVVDYVHPAARAAEVRFGKRTVTVTAHEVGLA